MAAEVSNKELDSGKYVLLMRDMMTTCKIAKGAGLAANQVGVAKRIIVTNHRIPLVWVNPKIVSTHGEKLSPLPEGCLSLPGKIINVSRYAKIAVEYQDMHGNKFTEIHAGPLAVILQHEIDHLDGILITDYEEVKEHDSATTAQ